MSKKRKALSAKDVGKDPSLLDTAPGRFVLLRDMEPFDTMTSTLDLIASRGWRVVGMSTNPNTTGTGIEMYVLVQHEQTASNESKPWPYDA
jgi:hypothetical protein